MTSFNVDNREKLFFSPNKNNSNNEYPLILTNRNQNDNNQGEKYIQRSYKKYKNSGNYGKKLNYALKQKSSKKD